MILSGKRESQHYKTRDSTLKYIQDDREKPKDKFSFYFRVVLLLWHSAESTIETIFEVYSLTTSLWNFVACVTHSRNGGETFVYFGTLALQEAAVVHSNSEFGAIYTGVIVQNLNG